jgi:glycosyltransferase involved in cell wall biosynthesis
MSLLASLPKTQIGSHARPNDKFLTLLPNQNRISVSVIIPTLNEAENLQHVLPKIPKWVHEVIIVDGRSTDDTVEVARKLLPDVRIVMEPAKGKGTALRTGFAAATGNIIVMMDADGSMDPKEIPAFVGALMAGADYVKGSRFLQGGGTSDMELHRQLGNWGLMIAGRLLFGGNFSDLCYGYNAFWTRVVPTLKLDTTGFEIETEMNVHALKAKLKITEVPSFESERVHGVSRLQTFPDGMRVLKTLLRERFTFLQHKPVQNEQSKGWQQWVDKFFNANWENINWITKLN